MGSRSITETQRVEIIRLRVEGNLSTPTIARKVGVCNQSVYRILEPHPWARPLAQAFHGDAWTERDKARLRTLYPVAPKAQVMAALSNRNWESIVRQASTMGVRRDSKTARRIKRAVHPVCERLREIRLARRITIPQLSDKIGYHISQLRNWELGINSPNLRQLTDWCTVFGAEIGIVDKRVELRVVEDTPLAQPDRARLMAGR